MSYQLPLGGSNAPAPNTVAGVGAHGSSLTVGVLEDLITCSGASSVSTVQIPNRAIVLGVAVYNVTAVTGATSYSVDATTNSSGGAGGTSGQFGSGLGVSQGSTNSGVIGPTAWYATSTIKLIAAGGNFTGGTVRISISYLLPTAPTS